MDIKIIIPVFEYNGIIDYTFPENSLIPQKQIEFVNDLYKNKSTYNQITVVTGSPYIAEGLCKVFDSENVIFSDGNSIIHSEDFFAHFAKPMKDLAFLIK